MLLDTPALIFTCLTILFTGVVFGFTGFGYALVATPLLILVLPPRTVVPLLALLGTAFSGLVLFQLRGHVQIKRVLPLIGAAILGAPFGTYLLRILEANVLRILLGLVSVIAALILLTGVRRPADKNNRTVSVVGFASGVLGGTTGMAGPLLVLFFTNQGVEKQVFKANLCAYFAVLGVVSSLSYFVSGLSSLPLLGLAALLLPAAVVGLQIGMQLERRVDESLFRKITLVLLIATSLVNVLSGAL